MLEKKNEERCVLLVNPNLNPDDIDVNIPFHPTMPSSSPYPPRPPHPYPPRPPQPYPPQPYPPRPMPFPGGQYPSLPGLPGLNLPGM